MKTYKILIPVFNDWDSLSSLLNKIHILKIDNLAHIKILIVDDCSTEILNKKIQFSSFQDVEIIKNSKNIGHGKSIARGINYLINKNDFDYLIVFEGISIDFIINSLTSSGLSSPSPSITIK